MVEQRLVATVDLGRNRRGLCASLLGPAIPLPEPPSGGLQRTEDDSPCWRRGCPTVAPGSPTAQMTAPVTTAASDEAAPPEV